jgi:hypothetical protein
VRSSWILPSNLWIFTETAFWVPLGNCSRLLDSGFLCGRLECKNYGSEISNPEIDQIAMRFSPARGQLGLLCYRGFGDKQAVVNRCRDAAQDGHDYVIALDDDDLRQLVEARSNSQDDVTFRYLGDRFAELL